MIIVNELIIKIVLIEIFVPQDMNMKEKITVD